MTAARIVIAGVGGQGVLHLTRLLAETCLEAEMEFTSREEHGMSQRGGAVTVHVVVGPTKALDFRPGQGDVVAALEPMEATRNAHMLRSGGRVVVDTSPIPPLTISMDKERDYPPVDELLQPFESIDARVHRIPAREEATRLGEPRAANVVLLGGLLALDILPLDRALVENTMATVFRAKLLEVNLKALGRGFDLCARAMSS